MPVCICLFGCDNRIPRGGLNNRIYFSYSSGGLNPQIKASVVLVFDEPFLPGLHMATFSLCACIGLALCVSRERARELCCLLLFL